MRITDTTPVGNFEVTIEIEIPDEQLSPLARALMVKGNRWLAQRNREVDTILGGTKRVPAKRGGTKLERVSGWTRTDCPYSESKAKELGKSFEELQFPDEDAMPNIKVAKVTVAELIRDQKDSKFTEEKAMVLNHESTLNDLEVWLKTKVGYEGDTHGEDGEYAVEMLRAVGAYKRAKLRERMAEL